MKHCARKYLPTEFQRCQTSYIDLIDNNQDENYYTNEICDEPKQST